MKCVYTVHLGKENHNAPDFTQPVYEVSVLENNPPSADLATVTARDPDLGHEGQATYQLLKNEVGPAKDSVSTCLLGPSHWRTARSTVLWPRGAG